MQKVEEGYKKTPPPLRCNTDTATLANPLKVLQVPTINCHYWTDSVTLTFTKEVRSRSDVQMLDSRLRDYSKYQIKQFRRSKVRHSVSLSRTILTTLFWQLMLLQQYESQTLKQTVRGATKCCIVCEEVSFVELHILL